MRSVLSVGLSEEIAAQLEQYAKATGRNKSDILKESISLYLWEERFRKSRIHTDLALAEALLQYPGFTWSDCHI